MTVNEILRSREEQIANSYMLNHSVVNSVRLQLHWLINVCAAWKRAKLVARTICVWNTYSLCTPITTTALEVCKWCWTNALTFLSYSPNSLTLASFTVWQLANCLK